VLYTIEITGRAISMLRSGTATRRQRIVLHAAIIVAAGMLLIWVLLALAGTPID
jgi:hypothetical protein